MLDYGYSITLIHWLTYGYPSVMSLVHTPMQSNHRVHTTSKNLEIPKGITIINWGRLYNDKPTLHICVYPRHTHAAYPNINDGLYQCHNLLFHTQHT